jgi:polysaccharide biosynthesis/export protein
MTIIRKGRPLKTITKAIRTSILIALSSNIISACTTMPVAHLPMAQSLPLVDEVGLISEPLYKIRAGDELDIKFFYTKELNENVKVRPDGFISLQLVDDVNAAGLTPQLLDQELTTRYSQHLKNPVLSVIVRNSVGYRAYVGGEVGAPQLIPLEGGVTPLQALFRAGGMRPTAQASTIILIRKGENGQPLVYQLDLSEKSISEGRRDLRIAMRPSDVLFVPRSPIANANLWVQQYISDLVLFRGVNLGYSHSVLHNGGSNVLVVP